MSKEKKICYDMQLVIDGIGIVLYSDGAIGNIEEGEDFFNKEFSTPEQVVRHINKGDIIGFNTGTSGNFNIKFRSGYPNEEIEQRFPVSIRLAINVKGGKLSVIDLFWLMDWSNDCPLEQQISIDDGIYHLTISTVRPKSGIWGDNQEIYIYLNRLEEMPKLTWTGIPQLFTV